MFEEETISESIKKRGNLLEQFLDDNKSIEILRVYPYESKCASVIFSEDRKYIEHGATPEDLKILEVIDLIRKTADEKLYSDNKIVIETYIGGWHVFVGYWDDIITVGLSVIPTRAFPRFKTDEHGSLEEIKVR